MRLAILSVILLIVGISGWLLLSRQHGQLRVVSPPNIGSTSNQSPSTPDIKNHAPETLVPLARRQGMTRGSRLNWLEQHGRVPDDAEAADWSLAQETSWWGKPIDPKSFWSNRVVWLSDTNEMAARRLGRRYPPMPYQDGSLAAYHDKGEVHPRLGAAEGPAYRFHMTSLENAFWDKHTTTHPYPPENITRAQVRFAESYLRMLGEVGLALRSGYVISREEVEQSASRKRQDLMDFGYPPESLSSNALFWSHVETRRAEYARLTNLNHSAGEPPEGGMVPSFFKRLAVAPKWITEPMTEAQTNEANAWKIEYLQRLKRENIDSTYINAYLQTWKLASERVFPQSAPP